MFVFRKKNTKKFSLFLLIEILYSSYKTFFSFKAGLLKNDRKSIRFGIKFDYYEKNDTNSFGFGLMYIKTI